MSDTFGVRRLDAALVGHVGKSGVKPPHSKELTPQVYGQTFTN
ncbi:MAG TPA: hypothetical protein VMS31_15435 [Pyrinomonadaceae bacterium]|nr:hypothetical protein [Pyrinomonadaceae bacterium]